MQGNQRQLVVTADDFGIGPATSQGILELGARGLVTGTVMLVNSPYAETAVRAWRQAGEPVELGWHPCLTIDRPVMPAGEVPTLVARDGRFFPLGQFVRRLATGEVETAEIALELRAQYHRFCDLVGRPPAVVNTHHHVQVFYPIGPILHDLLIRRRQRPYLRRIREPWHTLRRVPGARLKRSVLNLLGRVEARQQARAGLPGNDWLAGITDPPCVADPEFLARWLRHIPGHVVELTCHPGHHDSTLIGRDCTAHDGQLERRVREYGLLGAPAFAEACRQAGFALVPPGRVVGAQAVWQTSAA